MSAPQPFIPPPPSDQHLNCISHILAGLALAIVLYAHLLPALYAGLTVYALVSLLSPLLLSRCSSTRAELISVSILTAFITLLIAAGIILIIIFFHGRHGGWSSLLEQLIALFDGSRTSLPTWLIHILPPDLDRLNTDITHWIRDHFTELRLFGAEAGRIAIYSIAGLLIGILVVVSQVTRKPQPKPLAAALGRRISRFSGAFRQIIFAQIKIATINTLLAALYLVVVLPLFNIHLPLAKTLVVLTFIAGLLPVVGNLVSNTIIVAVSFSVSLPVAAASLLFLVLIHKLEYFLNSFIISSQIHSHPWEILLAMLVMQALFGIHGLIAAPVFYAYIKTELEASGLV